MGTAFVAQFGDMTPPTGAGVDVVAGHVVARVSPSGEVEDFLTSETYPDGDPFIRPTDATFSPAGDVLYVVHFGEMMAVQGGLLPTPETGALIRIRPL